jgi:putative addiction module component (TIGR02574 family)
MATTEELLKLDLRARLKLIDDLWESVLRDLNDPDSAESLPIPDELKQLLDRRMKAYRASPDAGSSWPAVRERIIKRR